MSMGSSRLACRVYIIEPTVLYNVKELLLEVKENTPMRYSSYPLPNGNEYELSVAINTRIPNQYGTKIIINIDDVMTLLDREKGSQIIRYYNTYELQFIECGSMLDNHLIIFGPKPIDRNIISAIKNYLKTLPSFKNKTPDPLILLRADLKNNIDKITERYSDLQHFCIIDIPDDRTKDIVVKGNQLEHTDLFERFVKDEYMSGSVNFLGLTLDTGKIIYVGSDGSIYSRNFFKEDEKLRIIQELYIWFIKNNMLMQRLEIYYNKS